MEFEKGKVYKVLCQRKGEFSVKITEQDDEWTSGIITEGETNALCEYNILESGDEVTFRTSFVISASEVK